MSEKKESIWKFYFQTRWQTVLTTHFLITAVFLCFFFFGNIWNAAKFALATLMSSADMLGLEFALWGILFEIAVVIPFLVSFYSIFLLPLIWRSWYRISQKLLLTVLMLIVAPMLIIITDQLARFALQSDALREFVNLHKIV